MTEPQWITAAVVLAVAAVTGTILYARGVMRGDVFDRAPLRAGWLRVGDLLAGTGLWLVGGTLGVAMVRMRLGVDEPLDTAAEQLQAMGGMIVGTLPALVFIIGRAREAVVGGLDGFGLGSRSLFDAPAKAAVGFIATVPLVFAASLAVTIGLVALDRQPPTIAHSALDAMLSEPWGPVRIGLIAFAVVAAPIVEEVVFRGLIQTAVRNAGLVSNPWWAILAATVPFTAIHINLQSPASLAGLPAIYVLSIGLGWVYERTGNLWATILMHSMFNAMNVAMALTGLVTQ